MLDKKVTTCIKGIAALFIMLGHFLPSETPGFIRVFFYGPVWVGLFFFFSGYGIRLQANASAEYIKRFLLNKLQSIWIPFAVAEVIFLFSSQFMTGAKYGIWSIIGCMFGAPLSNDTLWYVVELAVMELLFWIFEKTGIRSKKVLYYGTWIIIYVLFMFIAVIADIGTWWYVSTMSFLIGLYVGDYEEKARRIATARNKLIPVTVLTIVVYVLVMAGEIYSIGPDFLRITYYITGLTIFLVPMFTVTIVGWISDRSSDLKAFTLIGEMSYYVYLYQILVKRWIDWITSGKIWSIFVIALQVVITLIIAYVIRTSKRIVREHTI